jgi:hypothetical protein
MYVLRKLRIELTKHGQDGVMLFTAWQWKPNPMSVFDVTQTWPVPVHLTDAVQIEGLGGPDCNNEVQLIFSDCSSLSFCVRSVMTTCQQLTLILTLLASVRGKCIHLARPVCLYVSCDCIIRRRLSS